MRYEGLRPNFDSKLLRESGPRFVNFIKDKADWPGSNTGVEPGSTNCGLVKKIDYT